MKYGYLPQQKGTVWEVEHINEVYCLLHRLRVPCEDFGGGQ